MSLFHREKVLRTRTPITGYCARAINTRARELDLSISDDNEFSPDKLHAPRAALHDNCKSPLIQEESQARARGGGEGNEKLPDPSVLVS